MDIFQSNFILSNITNLYDQITKYVMKQGKERKTTAS